MLQQLRIEDYGLIAKAEITFAPGATMFTGETGSGKTMVLGALAFALGERSRSDALRRGRPRATVTLEFDADAELRARFDADGFGVDADEAATISRELNEAGKSTLRLNGRPASAGYIREIAAEFVDIIGQHEAQRLLAPAFHLELLDRFAGDAALRARERVAALHAKAAAIESQLRELTQDERRAQERFAYAKYALEEIESVNPEIGEDVRLSERRRFLDNVERIAMALRGAHDALVGEASAADALGTAATSLRGVREIGSALAEAADAASALQSEIHDLAVAIARELDSTEFEPAELESINARLSLLENLKHKYGGTLAEVLSSAKEFQTTVALFGNADERKAWLQADLQKAKAELQSAGADLTALRKAASERLQKAVEAEFKDLALASARFSVQFEALSEVGASGAEHVEFLFAANKGEVQAPLGRIASGGELARVLLALVVVLAGARGRTALIFDEVDADIGGATATAVGVRLGRLARSAQVVCVTHLAQIASWADVHYVLEKEETRSGTTISVRPAQATGDRASELARMLSGETHDVAIKHARELLRQTADRRSALA